VRHAQEEGEVPIGAVVALNGKIVGEGWNPPIAVPRNARMYGAFRVVERCWRAAPRKTPALLCEIATRVRIS